MTPPTVQLAFGPVTITVPTPFPIMPLPMMALPLVMTVALLMVRAPGWVSPTVTPPVLTVLPLLTVSVAGAVLGVPLPIEIPAPVNPVPEKVVRLAPF